MVAEEINIRNWLTEIVCPATVNLTFICVAHGTHNVCCHPWVTDMQWLLRLRIMILNVYC